MSENAFFSPQLLENIISKIYMQQHKPGLYIVATPIGNIFDITLRAIHILKRSKYIFAEDTRESKKILNFYEINSKLISCHEHNENDASVHSLIRSDETYSLISDAGTPLISDPGYKIVNWCINNNINVFPIPGASSPIAALSASGMATDNFTFIGFLPNKSGARKNKLYDLLEISSTTVYFESPTRLIAALQDMLEVFGDRKCCICREITKIYEEFHRGSISECVSYFKGKKPIGEFIIIVDAYRQQCLDENNPLNDRLSSDLKEMMRYKTLKLSVLELSQKYNVAKSVIYKKALEIKNEEGQCILNTKDILES